MEKENPSGIKITDRRRFSSTGEKIMDDTKEADSKTSCTSEEVNNAKPTASNESSDKTESSTTEAEIRTGNADSQAEVDFSSFVVSLATQAMMMLGQIPSPDGAAINKNVLAAKQTIDILGMLQEKTKGNLSKDEDKLIEDVLASLRMAYVETVKK